MDSDEQTNTTKVDSAETISPPAEGNHENSQKTALFVSVPEKKLTSPSSNTLQQTMRMVDASDYEDEKSDIADSNGRDASLARVEMEKRLALIKAWEESKKSKTDNKAYKKKSAIGAWETTRRASIEAELKQIEEDFEKKKGEYGEKMKNKIAEMHKEAEQRKAMIEAKREEEILEIEEMAARSRATGNVPKRLFGCFAFLFFF